MKGNCFYTFLIYSNLPPPKNYRCILRDVREIQLTLQQYRDVTTILAMIIYGKVSTLATCKSLDGNEFLYLQGIFFNLVLSWTQVDYTLGGSVGIIISWVFPVFNINQR